jgi:hypothetical protein
MTDNGAALTTTAEEVVSSVWATYCLASSVLSIKQGTVIINNYAYVVGANIESCNGLLHAIDHGSLVFVRSTAFLTLALSAGATVRLLTAP